MSFNPDPTKMAQEVSFSRKRPKVIHPSLIFNGKDVSCSESHKHLGFVFDPKLNFYDTRNNTNVPSFNCRTEYFKNSFFPNVITEWNKLDIKIKSMTSYTAFKNALLSFI